MTLPGMTCPGPNDCPGGAERGGWGYGLGPPAVSDGLREGALECGGPLEIDMLPMLSLSGCMFGTEPVGENARMGGLVDEWPFGASRYVAGDAGRLLLGGSFGTGGGGPAFLLGITGSSNS